MNSEERAVIMIERRRGASFRATARLLSRDISTISREPAVGYDATRAATAYRERRRTRVEGTASFEHVHNRLRHWPPKQIARRLARMHVHDQQWRASHETLICGDYAAICAYPRGALKQSLIEALRQGKPARRHRRRTLVKDSTVPEDLRIVHRPENVPARTFPGHWEGDFIKGAYNRSAVGTLVERKTPFVVRMRGCGADAALEGCTRQLKKLPAFLRPSLTYDRSSEMARHAEPAERLKIDIGFADPYAPWQGGSNENTDGLLRQFLPKSTDLSTVSQIALNDIARLLNGRPRKTLDRRTPDEAMSEEIANFSNRVALDS